MCRVTNTPTHEDFMFLMKAISDDARQDKEAPKSVRFASHVTISAPGPLPFREVKGLWYDSTELSTFKNEAKQIISCARKGMLSVRESNDMTMRGLEHCTPQRQKNRRMSIRHTVNAYRQGMDARQTANLSRRYSLWTGETAFVQGCHDFANVYQPTMTSLIPGVKSLPHDFTTAAAVSSPMMINMYNNNFNKRQRNSFSSSDCENRRVRRRTTNLL